MPADRFTLPTTPEEWAAVEPNVVDCRIAEQRRQLALTAAAARLLARERCVERLADWLAAGDEHRMDQGMDVARCVLEDAK